MTIPDPIPNREDLIGGIESIVLDGQRMFFGFSYSDDLVTSPLLKDAAQMAAFAATHMQQRDGKHNQTYWSRLVAEAVASSELCLNDAERSFLSAELNRIPDQLKRIEQHDTPDLDLKIPYHLLYLLGAASGWTNTGAAELERLGTRGEDVSDLVDWASGKEPLNPGVRHAEVARAIQGRLNGLLEHLPANWGAVFAMLRS